MPDDLSGAAALSAGPRDDEESLLVAQLTASLARRALDPPRAGLGAAPLARLAGLEPRDLKLRLEPVGRVLERDLEVVAEIVAGAAAAAPAAPAPAASSSADIRTGECRSSSGRTRDVAPVRNIASTGQRGTA